MIIFLPLLAATSVILYYLFYQHNKNSRPAIERFISQSANAGSIQFKEVSISYWRLGGYWHPSFKNKCDLFVTDDWVAILRRTDLFNLRFPPILISRDTAKTIKQSFFYMTFKPDAIFFKDYKKEILIKITENPKVKTEITLRDLTDEQMKALEKMRSWTQTNN